MSVELTMLFWAVVLAFCQMFLSVLLTMTQVSMPELAGNREGLAEATGMTGRARRAHRNMLENLVLFATLVLIVELAGLSADYTVLGAQIFVIARLIYAVIYVVGVPWLRTAVWAVSVVGMVMIAWPIVGA